MLDPPSLSVYIFLVEVGTPAALEKYIFTHTQRDSSRHTMKGACHERYFILIPPKLKRVINISMAKIVNQTLD